VSRVLAVDWSGRAAGAAAAIAMAEVRDSRLVALTGGHDRRATIDRLLDRARPGDLIGLDFGFSFPAWWCRDRGWRDGRAVWAAMAREGEALLAACEPPLWGRPGRPDPNGPGRGLRRTEAEHAAGRPKSVFQIGGAGAVGTGSIRGMPFLAELADAGFAVWPFTDGAGPRVVEIYPRAFSGPVVKSDPDRRAAHLRRFSGQDAKLLALAAASEDAFDAAVSALAMARHARALRALAPAPPGSLDALEGRIWAPA
jgi:hypothetical protein